MTEMTEEKKIKGNFPNLRFPEFQGEWEETRLGKVADVSKLAGYEFTKHIQYEETGKIIALRGLNIKNNALELSDVKYIDNSDLSKLNRSKLFIDDLMFTYIGTIGEVALIKENDIFYLAPNVSRIRVDKNKIAPKFLLQYFNQPNFRNFEIKKYISSSSQPALTMENVRKFAIFQPMLSEQNKITAFFSLLDQRIETQTKIIEKYESLIKGIVDLLFKAKERNVQLKDCVTCHSSTLTESEVLEKKGIYPVYGAAGIITYFPDYNISEDSILIIKDGSNVGKLQYTFGKYSVIGTLNYLTVKGNNCLKYIYYCMRSLNFGNYKVGSGIPHIYFKDYGNELIYCPNFAEQEKIANALSMIDRKILIEKKLLENYVTQKKYLLQNLFI
jgi:type I restriction enzyme S subunit